MRRRAALAGAGVLVACAALLLTGVTAEATGRARMLAATLVARQVGHRGLTGPAPDRALVLGAWRDAGVDIRGLGTPFELLQACEGLAVSRPRPLGPAPGDYALYRDGAGADRAGMFLSPLDVAIVDGGAIAIVPRPALSGDNGDVPVDRLLAQPGSFHVCRLDASRWPGGTDDTAVGTGRIALADPEQTAEHLAWAAAHPRDADTGIGHALARIIGSIAAPVVAAVEQLAGSIFASLHALLAALPWHLGAPLLLAGDLVGRHFDGRLLHRILTAVAIAAGALLLLSFAPGAVPLLWVLGGALLGGAVAARAGVPVLGAAGGALVGGFFAVVSFLVGVATGVDDSDNVCVGTVLFAVVADLVWLRPLMAATSAAAHLERLAGVTRLLDVSGAVGDALALRPHAFAEVTQAVTQAGGETLAAHQAMSGGEVLSAMARRGADLLTLTYRPSSIGSDLMGHAADAVHFVDGELRAGFPSWSRLRQAFEALAPERRAAVLRASQQVSTHVAPPIQAAARLSHLHSGARTFTALGTGESSTPAWLRAWRSPVVRRVLRGLPGRP